MEQRREQQDVEQPLNNKPFHRGAALNKNGPARVKRWMQWETPFNLLAVQGDDDPLLLEEGEVHAKIGINWA